MVAQAGCYGEHVGIYAQRLLDGDAPWMMMRSVYRLVGLAKRYGPAAEAACARALDVDVINVSKIESMLKNATETSKAACWAQSPPGPAGSPATRPSTPPRPVCGCRSWTAAASPDLPAAAGPAAGAAACARLIILSPVFFSFLFFSERKRKRKAPT